MNAADGRDGVSPFGMFFLYLIRAGSLGPTIWEEIFGLFSAWLVLSQRLVGVSQHLHHRIATTTDSRVRRKQICSGASLFVLGCWFG